MVFSPPYLLTPVHAHRETQAKNQGAPNKAEISVSVLSALLRIRQAARLPTPPIGRIYPEGTGGLEL